jgi:hypothetical protein
MEAKYLIEVNQLYYVFSMYDSVGHAENIKINPISHPFKSTCRAVGTACK